jgi:glycosyltransferase involved in cell wall biosynthesis
LGIPEKDFVIGHLGRLAPEKNLEFLAQAVADFLRGRPQAHFILIGTGPLKDNIRKIFARAGVEEQFHQLGILQKQELADALHAMDVFAFSSESETQGMVVTEAMAAGLPVVALDAPGVRDVVKDRVNGRLLQEKTPAAFSAALQWISGLEAELMSDLKKAAIDTARDFSISRTARKALDLYEKIKASPPACTNDDEKDREDVFSWVEAEWEILKSFVGSCGAALSSTLFSEKE